MREKNIQELFGSSFENKIHFVKFDLDKNDSQERIKKKKVKLAF